MKSYSKEYGNYTLGPLRVILLTLAFLIAIVSVIAMLSSLIISGFNKEFFIYLGLYVLAWAVRITTLFMVYKLKITYTNGSIVLTKIYPHKSKELVTILKKDIKKIELKNQDNSAVDYYIKGCDNDCYMIELSSKNKYLLPLNDYLYCLLTCEEQYDLFR